MALNHTQQEALSQLKNNPALVKVLKYLKNMEHLASVPGGGAVAQECGPAVIKLGKLLERCEVAVKRQGREQADPVEDLEAIEWLAHSGVNSLGGIRDEILSGAGVTVGEWYAVLGQFRAILLDAPKQEPELPNPIQEILAEDSVFNRVGRASTEHDASLLMVGIPILLVAAQQGVVFSNYEWLKPENLNPMLRRELEKLEGIDDAVLAQVGVLREEWVAELGRIGEVLKLPAVEQQQPPAGDRIGAVAAAASEAQGSGQYLGGIKS